MRRVIEAGFLKRPPLTPATVDLQPSPGAEPVAAVDISVAGLPGWVTVHVGGNDLAIHSGASMTFSEQKHPRIASAPDVSLDERNYSSDSATPPTPQR